MLILFRKNKIECLECPVCFQTIDSFPIDKCQNGHVVCKDCHPKLENCPICRDEKGYNPQLQNLKLEETVKRYFIKRKWHLLLLFLGIVVIII